jgi:hypothetical protein
MSSEIFAEWLRRQGHRVVRTTSSYWYDQGPRVYQAFPYHWLIEPSREELQNFLHKYKAIGLRYSTPVSAPFGKLSYHVICEQTSFIWESLPRKVRQDIRKGNEYATIEQIPISRLATEGWDLRFDTLVRQGREKAENQAWWQRLCTAAEDLPGFDAWGALHEGQLVSSLLAFTCDECYTFLYQQSATVHLKFGINNALFYKATTEALNRKDISQVFVALHSLDASPDVDKFKFRMGFEARPVRQRVVFHSLLSPLFNKVSYGIVKQLALWNQSNPSLAKVKGFLSFYLQDRVPISEQPCPEPLKELMRQKDLD